MQNVSMLQNGETALTFASSSGNVPIVKALLEKDAKIDLHKKVRKEGVLCLMMMAFNI